jgi:hypothetical protein
MVVGEKMLKTNKKFATFAVLAVAGLLATLFVFAAPIRPLQSAQASTQEPPMESGGSISLQVIEPESFVQQTGKSAAVSQVASEQVSIKRGSSANIEVMAKHVGGANAAESINVKVLPPIGYTLYPPSVAKSTTPEERFEAARMGTVIPGSVDLAKFVTIVGPNEKAVSKASEQAFSVLISIPKDLPKELKEIFIPINIEATDSDGNVVPGQSTGIMVVVSE